MASEISHMIIADKIPKFEMSLGGFMDETNLTLAQTPSERCAWLRSQIMNVDNSCDSTTFATPFGERILTYADHTASGCFVRFIENLILNNVLPFYGNTHTDDSFTGARTTKLVKESANFIKHCLGGGEEDALLFCGWGCTAAIKRLQEVMGIALSPILRSQLLQALLIKERWVVFVGPYEHHSNLLSWRQSLAQVVEIPLNSEGLIDMEYLKLALESKEYEERPKLGCFSACSNVTGIHTDTRAIARLLHTYGAFACFDFAASAPHTQIDMRSGEIDGYDAIAMSPHKFIGGPGTPGVLLMSKNLYLLKNLAPSSCGGGTVCYVNGWSEQETIYHEDIEEREDAGTPPIIQKIKCALCFWINEYIGHSFIEQRESFFIQTALKRLKLNSNINVLGNQTTQRAPILSFLIYTRQSLESNECITNGRSNNIERVWRNSRTKIGKPLNGRFIAKLLNDLFGIQARGGCSCAGPYGSYLLNMDKEQSRAIRGAISKGYHGVKPGWARLSFSYYMTNAEFDYIMSAIEFIAMYGQRFLPFYDFCWSSGDWSYKKSANLKQHPTFTLLNSLAPPTNNYFGKDSVKLLNREEKMSREDKYSMYLDIARGISKMLPKFPPARSLPKNLSNDLVYFQV